MIKQIPIIFDWIEKSEFAHVRDTLVVVSDLENNKFTSRY